MEECRSPSEGLLYEEKNRLKRAVRKRIRWCAAKSERLRVQRRDRLFAHQDGRRFRTLQRKKSRCSKLIVDEEVVQDPERLLKVWANHFRVLAESSLSDGQGNSDEWVEKIKRLDALSYENEEYLLDVPFTSARAVHKLKKKKARGPDGLLAEHLKAGGDAVIIWLRNILNAVVELEVIPDVMKRGVVVPVYKGGGKDPIKIDSYRGITWTSIWWPRYWSSCCRSLEVHVPGGWPSTHKSDSVQESCILCRCDLCDTRVDCKHLKGGSCVFMCLCDMQKAFDSVEYAVLLKKLFEAGVNGKLWRVLKNWYEGGSGQVRLDGRLSESFEICKQRSVLSPALFLLVMDPLLRDLQASGVGLSLNGFYAGGFLHADDIRTLATSEDSLRRW